MIRMTSVCSTHCTNLSSTSRYEYCHIHAHLPNSSQGTIDNLTETPPGQETPKSAYLSTAKDILGVASSFTQMLLKKAPDVDGFRYCKDYPPNKRRLSLTVHHTGA